jgi:tRNA pseudouridine32 synthase/23S rRNA pseudouridine746 synthase
MNDPIELDRLPSAQPAGIAVVFQDDALLVVHKPAGLLSVPGRGADKQDCLSTRVQQQVPDALIVHRLDMATSGLMLMARSLAVQRTLSQAFSNRLVHKTYVAIVAGHLTAPGGGLCNDWSEINLPIAADWPRRPVRIIDPINGKPSLTRWRVMAHIGVFATVQSTRVELEPITGRTHQLRVHLQALGHPILGDALYASDAVLAQSHRLLLHASNLRFAHPTSAQPMHFSCPPEF